MLREQQAKDIVGIAVDYEDNPVGFAVVMVMGDRIHLHELFIAPEHGRKGLGTKLIETIIQFAKSSGFIGVILFNLSKHSFECTILPKARILNHERSGNWN